MHTRRIAVIGGGIIGASVAAQLTTRNDANSVVLYEKESAPGTHQTGHNSGVVHAGLYYQPGSLKARLTRRGVELLHAYSESRGIRYDECGKLVVAHTEKQLGQLDAILDKARANGVPGVAIIDEDAMREIEPHCVGRAAIHSPHTAIVDYPGVTRALLDDVRAAGGEVRLGTSVSRITRQGAEQVVHSSDGSQAFDYVIACNGLQSDRLAKRSGAGKYPAIVPFSGDYYKLTPDTAKLVNGLLYPVPDPEYPFLGVHLTRTVDGDVTVGPNAFLSFAREQYHRLGFNVRDALEIASSGAFWRFAGGNFAEAIDQLRTANKRSFLSGAQEFIPELASEDLSPGLRGVRAQAMNQDGTLEDDFVIQRVDNAVFVRNAPSPAATSAMAIAEHIIEEILAEDRLVEPQRGA